jgi:hypothetical protein
VRIGRPQTPPERLAAATGAESRRFGGRREGARRPAPKARGCYESCIFPSGSIVVYKESGSFWAWYSSRATKSVLHRGGAEKSRMDTTRPINNILCVGERDLGKWVTDTDDFFPASCTSFKVTDPARRNLCKFIDCCLCGLVSEIERNPELTPPKISPRNQTMTLISGLSKVGLRATEIF